MWYTVLHILAEVCMKQMANSDGTKLDFQYDIFILRDNVFTIQSLYVALNTSEIDPLSLCVLISVLLVLLMSTAPQ